MELRGVRLFPELREKVCKHVPQLCTILETIYAPEYLHLDFYSRFHSKSQFDESTVQKLAALISSKSKHLKHLHLDLS